MPVTIPAKHRKYLAIPILTAAGLMAAGMGCDRHEQAIRTYWAPKPQASLPVVSATDANKVDAPQWMVPAGWNARPPGQMLLAAFSVSPEDPSAAVTVAQTPPVPLIDNVNRWEGQLGLPHSAEADLGKVVQKLDLPAGEAQLVSLTSDAPDTAEKPRQAMRTAILEHNGRYWYFKLTGPARIVETVKPQFDAFLHSVQFVHGGGESSGATAAASPVGPSGPLPEGHPPIDAPATPVSTGAVTSGEVAASAPLKFETPKGWSVDQQPHAMRVLTLLVPGASGSKGADVSVIPLPSSPLLPNLNRWRGQVGLAPIASDNEAGGEPVTVAGTQCQLYDLSGAQQSILVVPVEHDNQTWYFKMTGPTPLVAAEKNAFRAFISSVRF